MGRTIQLQPQAREAEVQLRVSDRALFIKMLV